MYKKNLYLYESCALRNHARKSSFQLRRHCFSRLFYLNYFKDEFTPEFSVRVPNNGITLDGTLRFLVWPIILGGLISVFPSASFFYILFWPLPKTSLLAFLLVGSVSVVTFKKWFFFQCRTGNFSSILKWHRWHKVHCSSGSLVRAFGIDRIKQNSIDNSSMLPYICTVIDHR